MMDCSTGARCDQQADDGWVKLEDPVLSGAGHSVIMWSNQEVTHFKAQNFDPGLFKVNSLESISVTFSCKNKEMNQNWLSYYFSNDF